MSGCCVWKRHGTTGRRKCHKILPPDRLHCPGSLDQGSLIDSVDFQVTNATNPAVEGQILTFVATLIRRAPFLAVRRFRAARELLTQHFTCNFAFGSDIFWSDIWSVPDFFLESSFRIKVMSAYIANRMYSSHYPHRISRPEKSLNWLEVSLQINQVHYRFVTAGQVAPPRT